MADQRTKLQTYTQLAADNSAVITSSFEPAEMGLLHQSLQLPALGKAGL